MCRWPRRCPRSPSASAVPWATSSRDTRTVSTETTDVPEADAPAAPDAPAPLRLVVVTGMSGAGRSTAADNLEDLGWYVVDNLPPNVLPEVCSQARESGIGRLAVVLDVRTRSFFDQLAAMFTELSRCGTLPERSEERRVGKECRSRWSPY